MRQRLLAIGSKLLSGAWKHASAFLFIGVLLLALPQQAAAQHSVALNWAGSATCGTCLYNVYRSTTMGGPYTKINSFPTSSTSYTDSSVVGGSTYYYVVSTYFPGGTGAYLNFTSTSGVVTGVSIGLGGMGFTNLVGTCPNCGIIYQESQNVPGGTFTISDGGTSTNGKVFCTNADTNNAVFDSIKQCTIENNGSGYSPNFTQNIPQGYWDSGVAYPWSQSSGKTPWGYSNEAVAVIPTSINTKPNQPSITGVWR